MMALPQTHEMGYTGSGKRRVLVVDDEIINRELLKLALWDEYEVFTASDGESALELIRAQEGGFSLILLDLLMPGMHGFKVIETLKADEALRNIPIIVLTADARAEVESLRLGAVDFIAKPYPQREVILARVRRTIELSENNDIIRSTERDSLTGLYNRDYFYRYCRQFDARDPERPMDAIVLDVHRFRMINERYGKSHGDGVLKRVAERVRRLARESGGIVCRREADTFLIYRPHREDYQAMLDQASEGFSGDGSAVSRVRLRMGVYANVDKSIDLERRFDRAKMAADTVRSNYMTSFALYDNALHESEMYAERLLEDFHDAIAKRQFTVHFQPKFDIRPDAPVLSSAEALVRWVHPELGFISPGRFIPLFEENGLIQQLDLYVWREAAAQIADWKKRLGLCVPVSVNVSRIDMYDPNLIDTFQGLLREHGLSPEELLLEITESAYTQDSTQMISKVNSLRGLGFHIEMDDFGTGYSSLNMISTLPIDALKLDMTFIRNAFKDGGDVRLIELIIDIAEYLSVPVIAEGVETEAQLNTLRDMGCDLVQGYYFSKPVPAEAFEPFIEEKKRRLEAPETLVPIPRGPKARNSGMAHQTAVGQSGVRDRGLASSEAAESAFRAIAQALSGDFESVYYVDLKTDAYTEYTARNSCERLGSELGGANFFGECCRNIPGAVYSGDQARMLAFMDKRALLETLEAEQTASIVYRLLIDGAPARYRLKAVRAGDGRHTVIGVSKAPEPARHAGEGNAPGGKVPFASIAQALAADYFSIYYVDTDTDRFIEYSADADYDTLGIEKAGDDFFNLSRTNIRRVIHPEDKDKVLAAFTKKNLLAEMEKGGTFTLNYRLMFGDKVNYVAMKASRMADENDHHIVIGVNNINAQVQRQMDYDAARAQSDTYSRIAQALSWEYYSIYPVNTESGGFIEYSSSQGFRKLQAEQNGADSFKHCRRSVLRMPDDLDRKYIVIGISNVDEQMKREQEMVVIRDKANRDALTGVRSKHAYVDAVAEINTHIDMGQVQPFSVVVCDVNGLKTVNDTQGYHAGDKLIQSASEILCGTFRHSPVYRVGGDEFVVIMHGHDHARRAALMAELRAQNRRNREDGGVVIACGMSEWRTDSDNRFEAVFDRADTAMYENKTALKAEV